MSLESSRNSDSKKGHHVFLLQANVKEECLNSYQTQAIFVPMEIAKGQNGPSQDKPRAVYTPTKIANAQKVSINPFPASFQRNNARRVGRTVQLKISTQQFFVSIFFERLVARHLLRIQGSLDCVQTSLCHPLILFFPGAKGCSNTEVASVCQVTPLATTPVLPFGRPVFQNSAAQLKV